MKKKIITAVIVVETILVIVLGITLAHKHSQVHELIQINKELLELKQ